MDGASVVQRIKWLTSTAADGGSFHPGSHPQLAWVPKPTEKIDQEVDYKEEFPF